MPIRRIAKVTGINVSTLYGKIEFLHRQCLALAADRERVLQTLDITRLYISVDRQEYMVNWNEGSDRRNIRMRAVGRADNDSGYVFGMHLNFNKELDPAEVEKGAALIREAAIFYPHRKYARVWLADDYLEALQASRA